MTRKLIGFILVQARADDGLKKSQTHHDFRDTSRVSPEMRANRIINNYRRFIETAKVYPGHLHRLAYAIRIYSKGNES